MKTNMKSSEVEWWNNFLTDPVRTLEGLPCIASEWYLDLLRPYTIYVPRFETGYDTSGLRTLMATERKTPHVSN